MSSSIRVNRICEYCGNEFVAKTTVTRHCNANCAKRAHKARQRGIMIEATNVQTRRIINNPIEDIKAKEFLTIRDVAKLLNCSRQTIYNLVNNGTLKAVNLAKKKTLVKRSEIDRLFL
jgi:excisionase family DNA binding protein